MSADQIVEALIPPELRSKTDRKLLVLGLVAGGAPGGFVEPTQKGIVKPTRQGIDLPTVTFDFGSAELTSQGRAQLDEVGEALSHLVRLAGVLLPGMDQRFRLIGHTDTTGPDVFNDILSLRRAETARHYLIRKHGLSGERLQVEGNGERALAWPTPDEVAEWRNRRVEVVHSMENDGGTPHN